MLRERVGSILPTAILRELWFDVVPNSHETHVPSSLVETHYRRTELNWGKDPKLEIIDMINYHSHYHQRNLTLDDLDNIRWYFDPINPHHISQALTIHGTDRSLLRVAKRFLQNSYDQPVDPWQEQKVLSILECYEEGEILPAVILTPRPLGARPNNILDITDGVHRLLALGIYAAKTGSIPEQSAFIAS